MNESIKQRLDRNLVDYFNFTFGEITLNSNETLQVFTSKIDEIDFFIDLFRNYVKNAGPAV